MIGFFIWLIKISLLLACLWLLGSLLYTFFVPNNAIILLDSGTFTTIGTYRLVLIIWLLVLGGLLWLMTRGGRNQRQLERGQKSRLGGKMQLDTKLVLAYAASGLFVLITIVGAIYFILSIR